MDKKLISLLLFALSLGAVGLQQTVINSVVQPPPAHVWRLLHYTAQYCTSCSVETITVSATTPGSTLILSAVMTNASGTATYVSSSGDTMTHPSNCYSTLSYAGPNNIFVNCSYKLSATGGATSFSMTMSGAVDYFGLSLAEWSWNGSSVTLDDVENTTQTGCLTCTGPSLTLTGTTDAVMQLSAPSQTILAITNPPYSSPDDHANGFAGAINQASYTQPTWTQAGGTIHDMAMSAIAFTGH